MRDSINLDSDDLLTLGEACSPLPSRPSPATLWRWRAKGVNGVKLECVRVGRRWYTTRAAMSEFISQQTAAATPSPDELPQERSETTSRRLKAAGLIGESR